MDKDAVIAHFAAGDDLSYGIKRLADALGISREAIYQWPAQVPELRAYQIERLTGGKLKVKQRGG